MNLVICDHCGTNLYHQKDGKWKSEAQLENEKLKKEIKELKYKLKQEQKHTNNYIKKLHESEKRKKIMADEAKEKMLDQTLDDVMGPYGQG
jgi:molecular chaperone GrpE (heat shock protein)